MYVPRDRRAEILVNVDLVEGTKFEEAKMETLDKRWERLESHLRRARRRALFVWALGLIVSAGAAMNIWLQPAGAQGDPRGLEQRVAALEDQISNLRNQVSSQGDEVAALRSLLAHFSREGEDVFITGANLHI